MFIGAWSIDEQLGKWANFDEGKRQINLDLPCEDDEIIDLFDNDVEQFIDQK